jgi:peptidyl-prolyl cis-trans isomerase B (cyclophilin B)
MRRLLGSAALGSAALGLALTACGGSSSGGSDQLAATPPPTSASGASATAAGCQSPPSAKPSQEQFSSEPKLTIAKTSYTARIVTNCGTIVVTLDGKNAPHTVNSFAFLAGKHFFDNTPCHRLTTSGIYVLQCGDPTGTGSGTPGYEFKDENLGAIKGNTYPSGTVAMANSGPNTNGSQFFLVYKNSPLQPNYTPFGQIVQGLDILKKIADAGSTPPGDGKPDQPVVIESFTVTKG